MTISKEHMEYRKFISESQVIFPFFGINEAFSEGGVTFFTQELFGTDEEFTFKFSLHVQTLKESEGKTKTVITKKGLEPECVNETLHVNVNVFTSPESYKEMLNNNHILVDLLHEDGRVKFSNYMAVEY
ncbi:hydroxylamine reductase-like protein [Bacillus phage Shbh1]|uniref:Hydroxylamine reductase-like protein n=1 Tax=Bacillus phage Shbh1 TaxID=1796992 RepID=A0A142F171_9CAUD|nr:hydroxylamine reductase-like protein [Bacillus phage Shbh1]AMQ66528.1 hydroxylamine reductase-like protein [Bacillus phage Shbh1]